MDNRKYLKKSIKKFLRKEVGFGCPVSGCRLPFLEYHHFDPPYSEGKIHNQDGMIAFCPTHHNQADQGAWSISDMHQMKKEKNREPVKGRLEWSIRESILIAGNNYFMGAPFKFRVKGVEVFGLEQDRKGRLLINSLLWNKKGEVVALINRNDISVNHLNIGDLNCMASGKKIRVETSDSSNYFEVCFDRIPVEDLIRKVIDKMKGEEGDVIAKQIGSFKRREKDGTLCLLTFKCRIETEQVKITIDSSNINMDFTGTGTDSANLTDRFFEENASLSIKGVSNNKSPIELLYLGK
ncbi:hypothetical protein [Priestia aryabhattai]|uniref:hypothetical protein n=1 Tax=Priestia aryabhattai TaxID=412384 RepID=UPI001C8E0C9A|nr:hypothetical protein [Priestia aryabhattai]MBX9986363.1 hypothetical protein [Priestia aryabhattai]